MHRIFLEKQWKDQYKFLFQETISIQSENALHILQVVSQFPTATLACVESSSHVWVSESRVSPYYLNQTTDTYLCYTKLPKDYAFPSVKDGTESFLTTLENRNKDNLDRPYVGNHDTYACTIRSQIFILDILWFRNSQKDHFCHHYEPKDIQCRSHSPSGTRSLQQLFFIDSRKLFQIQDFWHFLYLWIGWNQENRKKSPQTHRHHFWRP